MSACFAIGREGEVKWLKVGCPEVVLKLRLKSLPVCACRVEFKKLVKVWFRKFKAGNFDIEDEPRSGCPLEVDCEQLNQIIDQYRNVSVQTMALELEVCQKQ
ncbi:histone-lysine N-methyltransferase SETMAR [Trichonephila clavipes]|nr:histone-lysine N-methyltransferase SETMAR [Trichonephila clavipes]